MKRSVTVLIGALAAAAGSAQQPAPGQQPQTFKSGVQTVEVDVRVFDKSGRLVTDLKPEDFEVIEDGVPQKVQTTFLVIGPGGEASWDIVAAAASVKADARRPTEATLHTFTELASKLL